MPLCPVTFDFASAEEAALECRRHATYLSGLATARSTARTTAVQDWDGRFRDDFDREFTSTQERLRDEAERLRRMAGLIDDAAELARQTKTTCERDHQHGPPVPGDEAP